MNLSNAQLCIVALYGLNTLGLVCYFIVDRRDHLREVAELTARVQTPPRYVVTKVSAKGTSGPLMVSEDELMEAYLKQLGSTLPPGGSATLLRIRR